MVSSPGVSESLRYRSYPGNYLCQSFLSQATCSIRSLAEFVPFRSFNMWKIAFCAIFCYYAVCISCQENDEDIDLIFENKNVSCGQYLNKTIGSFHLALPSLSDKTCNWTIEVPPKNSSGIKLFFHFLFLHENDSVTIFKDCESANNDSLSLIDPLHAQNGSVTVFTAENSICIKLSGSDTSYVRKFEGGYTASQSKKKKSFIEI
ncbi:uncharacterized protein TNCT_410251 [Trichonephila clavata]|uniref:CUB domain-containing protein n=1 Tax=Trichonephila clavata TaxID=2740835 RepID=A0A8X6I0J8_TRICU|nr:uncharacterized protein TNCT_410251 [Trichonephila clavata]